MRDHHARSEMMELKARHYQTINEAVVIDALCTGYHYTPSPPGRGFWGSWAIHPPAGEQEQVRYFNPRAFSMGSTCGSRPAKLRYITP